MPAAVTNVFQRIGRVIAGFSVAQRTIAIIGVAVLVLGVVALSSWLTRPTYTPLFSGMSASDANAVVEQLRSSGVPYQLADGGATVLVPEAQVYDQRLAAASAGLPSAGSAGYSLLDDMGVTTSEFQQSVTYKRAIEGELAATISALEGVSAASVQLAIPEESVFVSETIEPTASVFVETAGGATLTAKQVEAVVHLTSAAVSGMKAENVTVVDQKGQTLSAAGVGSVGGIDQQASDYEARVTASVQQMLDTVVGPGKATVTVVAEIDRSVNERVDETYTPAEGAPPLSEQTRSQTQTGSGTEAGVLGPDNIAVPSADGDGAFESTEETRTNAVNKTTQSTSTPAGTLLRQSVSVAVDAGAGGDLSTVQLSDLVATAAGIDRQRGDDLTVELVAFSQTDAEAAQAALQAAKDAEEAQRQAALLNTVIIAAAIVLPLLLAAIAVILRARRRANTATDFDQLFGEQPAPLSALSAGAPTAAIDSSPTVPLAFLETAPDPDPEPEPEPAQVSLERRRAEVDAFTRQDPKRTAELLRTLIDDRPPA